MKITFERGLEVLEAMGYELEQAEQEPVVMWWDGKKPFNPFTTNKQAEQEPVAWMHKQYGHIQVNHAEIPDEAKRKYSTNGQWTPLCAAPVRTKDLTDKQIEKVWQKNGGYMGMPIDFARAVIAADRKKNETLPNPPTV